MMTEQWVRVRALFEQVVDLDADAARRSVAAATGETPDVRAEVLSLLDHHSRAGRFLEPDSLDAAATPALSEGTRIGRYQLLRPLGYGGMGCTYLAVDAELERQVCVKSVQPALADQPVFVERLRREARLMASLSHPGICAVYSLEECEGEYYLVTELVDGRTLREEIAAGVPSPDSMLETAAEIAAAVAAAHARGIVHRDLKPENVMRHRDGRIKVLDFGLARQLRPAVGTQYATTPGVLIGTPEYLAPEQIDGQEADSRSDVFALGVLLYEWGTGIHPFDAPTSLGVTARIVGHMAPPMDTVDGRVPAPLARAVERCLEKRPGDRFADAGELYAALMRPARAATSAPPSTNWWRVHQGVLVAVYAMACAAAWQLNAWLRLDTTRAAFLLLGMLGTAGGVVRGHLLFTERTRPFGVREEQLRVRRTLMVVDLTFGAILFLDALQLGASRLLAAVLVIALALAIALSAVLIEPATAAGAFDSRR